MMIKLPIFVYKVTMLPYYDYNNDDSSDKIICSPFHRSKRIKESSVIFNDEHNDHGITECVGLSQKIYHQ